MNADPSDIRYFVEPGVVPKRIWFYAQRRAIAALRPARAFAIGVAVGFLFTLAVLGTAIFFSL